MSRRLRRAPTIETFKPVGSMRWLADHLVVVAMRPDPEPQASVLDFDGERSMMRPDACRPISPDLLEVKRRMTRVAFQTLEGSIGKVAYLDGQRPVAHPEVGCGMVLQRGVVFRAACSRKAFWAATSSLPARASRSS